MFSLLKYQYNFAKVQILSSTGQSHHVQINYSKTFQANTAFIFYFFIQRISRSWFILQLWFFGSSRPLGLVHIEETCFNQQNLLLQVLYLLCFRQKKTFKQKILLFFKQRILLLFEVEGSTISKSYFQTDWQRAFLKFHNIVYNFYK